MALTVILNFSYFYQVLSKAKTQIIIPYDILKVIFEEEKSVGLKQDHPHCSKTFDKRLFALA
jgi:hypothetical protein